MVERYKDAEIIVAVRERTALPRGVIRRLPNLRLVALVGRTTRRVDYAAGTEKGIKVATGKSNSPHSPGRVDPGTDPVVAAPYCAGGRGHEAWRLAVDAIAPAARLDAWDFSVSARSANWWRRTGRGLGMDVLVWGREASLAGARTAGYAIAGSQAEPFETADVLSLHVRLGPETRGIVGAADLAAMKPTALIVNTARAELIEPGALVDSLKLGRPGFAAVDVYEDEPVVDGDHPLLMLPNALCVPHLGWTEWDNFELYFSEAFEQIVAYQRGEEFRLGNPEVLERP